MFHYALYTVVKKKNNSTNHNSTLYYALLQQIDCWRFPSTCPIPTWVNFKEMHHTFAFFVYVFVSPTLKFELEKPIIYGFLVYIEDSLYFVFVLDIAELGKHITYSQ